MASSLRYRRGSRMMKPGLRPVDALLVPFGVGALVWLVIIDDWTGVIVFTLLIVAGLAFDLFWLSPRLNKRREKPRDEGNLL